MIENASFWEDLPGMNQICWREHLFFFFSFFKNQINKNKAGNSSNHVFQFKFSSYLILQAWTILTNCLSSKNLFFNFKTLLSKDQCFFFPTSPLTFLWFWNYLELNFYSINKDHTNKKYTSQLQFKYPYFVIHKGKTELIILYPKMRFHNYNTCLCFI